MGLPHLDFRVPESGWYKNALERVPFKAALVRVQFGPMLSSTGSLSLPYKIAIVAVMALVACGTLVTFGTAGAETAGSSSNAATLPGTDEASPQVQGQVVPPSQSLLTSQDLLSTLNLTDYSPADTSVVDSDDSDSSDNSDNKKKPTSRATTRPTTKATTKTPTPTKTSAPAPTPTKTSAPAPTPAPTTSAPQPTPSPEPKCTKKTVWVKDSSLLGGHFETKEVCS